jgi:predicted RNA polymerase sigma factor
VPLSKQDVSRWSRAMMDEAERLLASAARAQAPGRFQLEAAIQSVHAQRAHGAATDWESIALIYEGLIRISPTIGARVAHAAALAEAKNVAVALAALDGIAQDAVATYQPYWALRAHLLKKSGRAREANDAYRRAIGLSEDPAVRDFLKTSAAPESSAPR